MLRAAREGVEVVLELLHQLFVQFVPVIRSTLECEFDAFPVECCFTGADIHDAFHALECASPILFGCLGVVDHHDHETEQFEVFEATVGLFDGGHAKVFQCDEATFRQQLGGDGCGQEGGQQGCSQWAATLSRSARWRLARTTRAASGASQGADG